MAKPTAVYLEVGSKKVFAAAIDWPGWCRAGRGEEAALAALADYATRYAAVAAEAGVSYPASVAAVFDIVEQVPGDATTDFGAPGKVAVLDRQPLTAAAAKRQARLVEAAWRVFDHAVTTAPAVLRKGPRGGGRDRDAMAEHVLAAEAGYARKIGIRQRQPELPDRSAITALRAAIIEVLSAASDGSPVVERGWPARYAARRIAWHVLDHVWEMEDRS